MRRVAVVLGVVLIASVVQGAPVAAAEQQPGGVPGVRVPVLTWTECGGGFQCGTADVPLDYRNPGGATISLGLTRKQATDPARRIGSLFVNPGGPGGAVDGLVRSIATGGPEEVRARFDVIGFDPRGVGRSSPLNCQTPREYADSWEGATARPAPGAFDRAVHTGRAFNEACVRAHGALLPFVGNGYTARDMDVLRAAVGDQKLSYLGFSFGTFIGTVYASLFPGRTRTLALDGAYDPQTYANRPYEYDFPQFLAVDGALGRFFDWCRRTPDLCAFGGGDPRRAYLDLQAALDANPVRDADGRLVANGASLALEVTFNLGSGFAFWPTLARRLVDAQNRTGPLLRDVATRQAFLNKNTAIECADRDFPRSLNLMRGVLRIETAVAPLNGPALAYAPPNYDHGHATACVPWPAERRSRYAGPFHARGSAPILVIGTTGDPDTPYRDAVTLSRTLANARLLTFRGEGHLGFFTSVCTRTAVTDYLVNGALPKRGTVCSDDPPPRPAGMLGGDDRRGGSRTGGDPAAWAAGLAGDAIPGGP